MPRRVVRVPTDVIMAGLVWDVCGASGLHHSFSGDTQRDWQVCAPQPGPRPVYASPAGRMAPAFFPVEPGQLLVLPEWLRHCAEPIESERRPVSVRFNIAQVAPPFVEMCGLLSKENLARVHAQLSGLSWRDGLVRGGPHPVMRRSYCRRRRRAQALGSHAHRRRPRIRPRATPCSSPHGCGRQDGEELPRHADPVIRRDAGPRRPTACRRSPPRDRRARACRPCPRAPRRRTRP